MANKITLFDTSILVDFYGKTDKANSVWISLVCFLLTEMPFDLSVTLSYKFLWPHH